MQGICNGQGAAGAKGASKVKTTKGLPSWRELDERFLYDPDTGLLVYRQKVKAEQRGEQAGVISEKGYFRVKINRRAHMVHRIAWKMHYGKDPAGVIDHVNGQTLDNRICNLREATHSQNCANSRAMEGKKVPLKGVARVAYGYSARIRRNGKTWNIGTFKTPEEAHAAYVEAAQIVFGEFANDGEFTVMEAKRKEQGPLFPEIHESNDGQ